MSRTSIFLSDGPALTPTGANHRVNLAVAAAASVLVHVAVVWSTYDTRLLHLDVGRDEQAERFIQVRRVEVDAMIEPIASTSGNGDTERPSQTLDLGQRGLELLAVGALPVRDPGAAPPITIGRVSDSRPAADAPAGSMIEPPVMEEEGELVWELMGPTVEKLPFIQTDDVLDGAGRGGEPYGSGGSGASRARGLLVGAALDVAAPREPAEPDAPEFIEIDPEDRRPTFETIELPPLDLSVFDLDASTGLTVPQYLDGDFEYVLHVYTPRQRWIKENVTRYFRVDITGRRSLSKLRTMPKDVVFLIDTSGSITQIWVDAVIRGVKDALSGLNPQDRFNIVMFKDVPRLFNTDSNQPVTNESLAAARRFLTHARAKGFTDVNRALGRLLTRDVAEDRVYDLILISDGRPTRGIKDTRELINLITRDNNLNASIYCVGVGSGQKRDMLEYLAYHNKGFCVFARKVAETAPQIRDLISRLRNPIIKELSLHIGGVEQSTVFPRQIPNIHDRESFSIYGRYDREKTFTMQITGTNHGKPVAFTFKRAFARVRQGDEQIAHQWAFWKLHHLYSEHLRTGDKKLLREIKKLARTHELETVY